MQQFCVSVPTSNYFWCWALYMQSKTKVYDCMKCIFNLNNVILCVFQEGTMKLFKEERVGDVVYNIYLKKVRYKRSSPSVLQQVSLTERHSWFLSTLLNQYYKIWSQMKCFISHCFHHKITLVITIFKYSSGFIFLALRKIDMYSECSC